MQPTLVPSPGVMQREKESVMTKRVPMKGDKIVLTVMDVEIEVTQAQGEALISKQYPNQLGIMLNDFFTGKPVPIGVWNPIADAYATLEWRQAPLQICSICHGTGKLTKLEPFGLLCAECREDWKKNPAKCKATREWREKLRKAVKADVAKKAGRR